MLLIYRRHLPLLIHSRIRPSVLIRRTANDVSSCRERGGVILFQSDDSSSSARCWALQEVSEFRLLLLVLTISAEEHGCILCSLLKLDASYRVLSILSDSCIVGSRIEPEARVLITDEFVELVLIHNHGRVSLPSHNGAPPYVRLEQVHIAYNAPGHIEVVGCFGTLVS